MEGENTVIATGSRSDSSLAAALKGKLPQIFEIGDGVMARRILEAVWEGADAGQTI